MWSYRQLQNQITIYYIYTCLDQAPVKGLQAALVFSNWLKPHPNAYCSLASIYSKVHAAPILIANYN